MSIECHESTFFHANQVMDSGTNRPIKLAGLDTNAKYRFSEINLYSGTKSTLEQAKVYSGLFLMVVGLNLGVNARRASVVLQLTKID